VEDEDEEEEEEEEGLFHANEIPMDALFIPAAMSFEVNNKPPTVCISCEPKMFVFDPIDCSSCIR